MSKYAVRWDGETVTLKDGSLALAPNLREATKLISEFVWQWRHGFIGPSGRLTAVPEAAGYWGGYGRKAYILKRNGFPCGILRIEKLMEILGAETVTGLDMGCHDRDNKS